MQTDATCWAQQCCVLLANNVASVWMDLNGYSTNTRSLYCIRGHSRFCLSIWTPRRTIFNLLRLRSQNVLNLFLFLRAVWNEEKTRKWNAPHHTCVFWDNDLEIYEKPVCFTLYCEDKFRISVKFLLKVTVHLERCFQFSVCNSVNTHGHPQTFISMESL